VDRALESSSQGIRAVKISLIVLGITAGAQALIVAVTGSVALLSDTIHNFSDALTAIPLWVSGLADEGQAGLIPMATAVPKTSQASSSWP
jgi:divalent metal cation (Fe/Co/Zn/Cd) transporter